MTCGQPSCPNSKASSAHAIGRADRCSCTAVQAPSRKANALGEPLGARAGLDRRVDVVREDRTLKPPSASHRRHSSR